jgi:hypothetical protein
LHYVAAPLRGEGGASFPCGHCSVGFLYGVGWWIWRRRRPRLAGLSLAAGLITGTALGLGRMAAGGHFLSDVIWSALIALAVAHLLWHYVLRIPARELAGTAVGSPVRSVGLVSLPWRGAVALFAGLGGLAVLIALFVTPHGTQLDTQIRLTSLPRMPRVFEVTARVANIDIVLIDSPEATVSISGELHGFGLPTSRLVAHTAFEAGPLPTLRYGIEQRGWFTDLSGSVSIRVPAGMIEEIRVRVSRGNIGVTDLTRERVVSGGRLRLDLRTEAGHLQRPTNVRWP